MKRLRDGQEEVLFDSPYHPEELDENEPLALHVMRGAVRMKTCSDYVPFIGWI